ncbi:MAG: hypothetical protein EOP50_15545 [Sphingobacteriales bacterium]|nr:MAG: hypothetical protein EOP50_15545 [Sphingobacteriales bacterium]
MRFKLWRRWINHPAGLFNGPFFDVRTLFVLLFDRMPSVSGVGEIDGGRAYAHLREVAGTRIVHTWQHSYFDRDEGGIRFNVTIVQLASGLLVEIGPTYAEVLHDGRFDEANALVTELAGFRDRPKETTIGFARTGNMN